MSNEKNKLLYEIARMYYEENMTQEQIAKQMGLSRQKVQRLINTAKKEGIVQIYLVEPLTSNKELEEELENYFKLSKAIIVTGGIKSENIIRKNIGRAAAKYIEEIIRDNDIMGIGWGRTVYETINYFKSNRKVFITGIPLIGGIGQISADFQVNELVKKFAEKSGGTYVPFYVPALVDNQAIADMLLSDKNISKAVKLWEKINIAIIGIGGPLLKDSYLPNSYYSNEDMALLEKEKSVGDILSYFFRIDGELCISNLSKKVVGISLDLLKKVEKKIAVVGSMRKKDAIFVALKEQFIDVLVTDDEVAKEILKYC